MIDTLPVNLYEVLLTMLGFNGSVLVFGIATTNSEHKLQKLVGQRTTLNVPKGQSLFLKTALVVVLIGMGGFASFYFALFLVQRGWIFARSHTPTGIIVLTFFLSLASLGFALSRTIARNKRVRHNVPHLTELYEFADRFVTAIAYVAATETFLSLGVSLIGTTLYSHYG